MYAVLSLGYFPGVAKLQERYLEFSSVVVNSIYSQAALFGRSVLVFVF